MLISNKKQFFLNLSLSLIWMGVIFAFSQQPYSGRVTEAVFHDVNVPVRKLAHMSEYCILFVLYLATIKEIAGPGAKKVSLFLALVLALLYAVTDEWHQAYVPGRSASFFDVLVDSCGALIGLGFVWARRQLFAQD
jgi:VanZ family protein